VRGFPFIRRLSTSARRGCAVEDGAEAARMGVVLVARHKKILRPGGLERDEQACLLATNAQAVRGESIDKRDPVVWEISSRRGSAVSRIELGVLPERFTEDEPYAMPTRDKNPLQVTFLTNIQTNVGPTVGFRMKVLKKRVRSIRMRDISTLACSPIAALRGAGYDEPISTSSTSPFGVCVGRQAASLKRLRRSSTAQPARMCTVSSPRCPVRGGVLGCPSNPGAMSEDPGTAETDEPIHEDHCGTGERCCAPAVRARQRVPTSGRWRHGSPMACSCQ
jgi:hypothetical protein